MKRFAAMKVAVVVGAVASLSAPAIAEQDARPVVFWATIIDPAHPAVPLSYRGVPGTFPTASVSGWSCTAAAPHLLTSPAVAADPAHGVPAMPATIGQTADLTCTTASGSVSVTAVCMLTSGDASDDGHFTVKDAQGHAAEVSIHCANNLAAGSLAELRALRPGDAISMHLALHASSEAAGDQRCNPPYTFDAQGLKHFKSECL
jgi:hypothetical protein